MKISVFDTTVADWNTGNRIIMEAVYREIYEMFPSDLVVTLPYWEPFGETTLEHIESSERVFFGGGNCLSDSPRDLFWGVTESNMSRVRNVILLGVGWWKYQDSLEPETIHLLRQTLSSELLHSVRDSHTAGKLASCGIPNTLVTGCPSMWTLTPELSKRIPRAKSAAALVALTSDYARKPERDRLLLGVTQEAYGEVALWPQGESDAAYARELGFLGKVLPANLPALDWFLRSETSLDYVGTRLHAGIRSLQHGHRSLIVGIDNRAQEMAADFNLPVVRESNLNGLRDAIEGEFVTSIRMPMDAIESWKAQFRA